MNLLENHDEIVAILWNGKTVTDEQTIMALIDLQDDKDEIRPISRAMCRMMSRLDLGDKWAEIADYPTLFRFNWGEYLSSISGRGVI